MAVPIRPLGKAVRLGSENVTPPRGGAAPFDPRQPVLVLLAAGKGTRFGPSPKCAQPVCGTPLARHTIDNARTLWSNPAVCVVGYRHEEVAAALGDDNWYVVSGNPVGGTAYAAYESLKVKQLEAANPVVVLAMGDRIVPPAVFRRLVETHLLGPQEADLTLLTARYEPPRNRGKGRVVRDADGRVERIVEQRDLDALDDPQVRRRLAALTEGNCPLYAVRARRLRALLEPLTNDNAQHQYYLTDIVAAVRREGGEIRTITTTPAEPDYDVLVCDVTRPMDLALLESVLQSARAVLSAPAAEMERAVEGLLAQRPAGQAAAIARQLEELMAAAGREEFGFQADQPVAVGVSGGRLRIAFMHPDMGRFFGPAWQMPIGAKDASGDEQVVVLIQAAEDGNIHLLPTNPQFREKLDALPADREWMYPGEQIRDWYAYETFGARMTEDLLLSLGYFSDEEVETRRRAGKPLPPPSLWVSNSMRRPFSLVGNAIASLRTLREGNLGARVQTYLGRQHFRGLRIASTGAIPQGGFSSSSAVTVAVKNALNALYELGLSADMLVYLACQAEYGTGVRAGSLDQATEQKGKAGVGALISSNPRENYRIIGEYPAPAERFRVLFPYSVDRDREAWRWSAGTYAPRPAPGRLTAAEMRKMTGKAAELAAVITRLPLDCDFFQVIEPDLTAEGRLTPERRRWVSGVLRSLPLAATQDQLRALLEANRRWHVEQLMATHGLSAAAASRRTESLFQALLDGWRDPVLRRWDGRRTVDERGAPLRAMVGYLFGEVAKNFHLIRHPDQWIEYVGRSQRGDCWFAIDYRLLPPREAMLDPMDWEKPWSGPQLMEKWLERFGARPFDYNRGLDDAALADPDPPPLRLIEGTNFFRGLALIDLVEAMLRRAFGADAVAVRVNAAGQGDYFQVHVDTHKADPEDVKGFIRRAFYRRFDLKPVQEFVEPHPGGGAAGVRLSRYDQLPELVRQLRTRSGG